MGCKGRTIPGAQNHYEGAESLWGRGMTARDAEQLRRRRKVPEMSQSNFFNTVHLLLKDLLFEHVGAKLTSCPGRHLTFYPPAEVSLRATFAPNTLQYYVKNNIKIKDISRINCMFSTRISNDKMCTIEQFI